MTLNYNHPFILGLSCFFLMLFSCNSRGSVDSAQVNQQLIDSSTVNVKLDPKATVIFQDSKGNYWFGNSEMGVYVYDGENLSLYTSSNGLANYRIISVQEDQNGILYFDTPDAVFKFDGISFVALPIANQPADGFQWQSSYADLWFRMGWDNPGPYRFDGEQLYPLTFPKNDMETEFYKSNPNASINPYAIFSMYKDRKGNTWFGTSNLGVYCFDGKEVSWMYEKQWLETPAGGNFGVRAISEDSEGNFWISNANYRYSILPDRSTNDALKMIQTKRQEGVKNSEIDDLYFYAIERDRAGNLLMFAQEDGLWINDGKELTKFFIKLEGQTISPTSMYQDNQGIFWFGTAEMGIVKYDGAAFERVEF